MEATAAKTEQEKLQELLNNHERYNAARKSSNSGTANQAQEEANLFAEPESTDFNTVLGRKEPEMEAPRPHGASGENTEKQTDKESETTAVKEDEGAEPDPVKLEKQKASRRNLAKVMFNATDQGAGIGLSMLANSYDERDTKQFHATPDEKEELIEAWYDYLMVMNVDLSPGWILLLSISLIYGPKVPGAVKMRRQKARKAENNATEQHKPDSDDVEDMETEEMDQEKENYERLVEELDEINERIMADAAYDQGKLVIFANPKPKAGFDKWEWMINNELVAIDPPRQFADNTNSARWATLKRMINSRGIPWPQCADDNPYKD